MNEKSWNIRFVDGWIKNHTSIGSLMDELA
jgi:hypothetical protein